MKDKDCAVFLQWALPRMQLSWSGFRKVRRTVCKRVDRRCSELGLGTIGAYRDRLDVESSEWEALRACCSISVSRFYRDAAVFETLEHAVLPALDSAVLKRAADACYRDSALKELPRAWRTEAFDVHDDLHCVRQAFRKGLTFVREDICAALPERHFDLILCRNVVFTYFSPELQMRLARQLTNRLHPGGALVIGLHENLPADTEGIERWPNARAVFRRSGVWESAPTPLPDEQEWEGT